MTPSAEPLSSSAEGRAPSSGEAVQQFSILIGLIYDAALDPQSWPTTLDALAGAFGACFAAFGWEDTRVMAVGGSYANRRVEEVGSVPYRERYKQTLIYSNPMRVPVLLTQDVEDVFTPGMLVPVEEYQASRYYREYVQPMGWGDGLSTILSKKDGVVHFLAFARKASDPPFQDQDIDLLKLLSPHLRRAYAIADLIGRQKTEIAALAETFDGLRAAVFMIDADRHVVYRNKSAEALLARATPFVILNECLTAVVAKASFDGALCACLDCGAGEPASVVLPKPGGMQHIVHILPFRAGERDHVRACSSAVASVFVTEIGLEPRSPVKTIAAAFDLTPREMSVLVAIVDVGSPADVAKNLGLTVHTVKSHLKAIFAKTGVARQADLVKLVAGFVGPTAGEL